MNFTSAPVRTRRATAALRGLAACILAIGLAAVMPGAASAGLGAWKFQTAPKLQPPQVQVLTSQKGVAPGDVFIAPFRVFTAQLPQVGQSGTLIADNKGNPVWFRSVRPGTEAFDFKTQTYLGKPVLTWWQGAIQLPPMTPAGVPVANQGAFYIYDQHYKQVAKIVGQGGYTGDFHDIILTPQGTAIFPAIKRDTADLSAFPNGSPTGVYEHNVVQEINVKTGKLVFQWDMSSHVALSDSQLPIAPLPGFVWDPQHINSIDVNSDGHILVSARSTSALYDVDGKTGNLIWTLGGKHSTFKAGPNADFSFQHDARFLPGNQVSMFDDSCCSNLQMLNPTRFARGLVVKLDLTAKTSTEVSAYTHSPGLDVPSQGSMQALANGDVFVGWGQLPFYSEYTSKGKLLYEVQLPPVDESYRARRAVWVGKPLSRPSIRVHRTGGKVTLLVSWNGATQVSSWQVLGGPGRKKLKSIKRVSPRGFETTIRFRSKNAKFEVVALDVKGKRLGSSRLVGPTKATAGAAAATTTITTKKANSKLGKVLATSKGFSIYVNDADGNNMSTCYGSCAKTWKPVLASGKVVAAAKSGLNAKQLGTFKRKDGKRQVAYHKRALYTYVKDKKASNLHGEGLGRFNTAWYLVATNGGDKLPVCPPGPACEY